MDSTALTETAYSQLCESYRAIDDFRSKLLGLLPAATGAAILLASKESPHLLKDWSPQIGIFGFLITCGLLIYEIYGIRKCAELIRAGKKLEIAGEVHGRFCSRPQAVWRCINEPLAAAIIYPVVLASWWVVFFLPTLSMPAITPIVVGVWVVAMLVLVGGFLGVLAYDVSLRKGDKADCDACGGPLSCRTPGRVTTSLNLPDYWLCRGCSEEVNGWMKKRRMGNEDVREN